MQFPPCNFSSPQGDPANGTPPTVEGSKISPNGKMLKARYSLYVFGKGWGAEAMQVFNDKKSKNK